MVFEANRGQTDRGVDFISRGAGYSLFLTPREAVFSLSGRQAPAGDEPRRSADGPDASVGTILRMRLLGANPSTEPSGERLLAAKTNYLIGRDPKRWRTGVPNYASVRYRELYPGIDLIYRGLRGKLEYDFVLAPRADPSRIALAFEGQQRLALDRQGALVLRTEGGVVRQPRPFLYQEVGGKRRPVRGGYVLRSRDRIGFRVGAYDRAKPLVIDPVLSYSRYLGGSGDDRGHGIAVDASGNAFVTGGTGSGDFPTQAPSQAAGGGFDAFVTKLGPDGALVYSTYLGGAGFDQGFDVAVKPSCASSCDAYVTGSTGSPNFPTTLGAFDPVASGGGDAFVTKLSAGGVPTYSTYLGGTHQDDVGRAISVGPSGGAYVLGNTASLDFPTKSPIQSELALGGTNCAGPCPDAFVTKLNPDASGPGSLIYSTYLGGSGREGAQDIALDPSDNAYVTGQTENSAFPHITSDAFDRDGGFFDSFVTKLTGDGALSYSTYLGGGLSGGIAVDPSGNAYLAGQTGTRDFPTTSGAFDRTTDGNDAFVMKLNALGSGLVYSTALGGRGAEGGSDLAIDSEGNAYAAGYTNSDDFPTRYAHQVRRGGLDAFLTKLNPEGSTLLYSTYLGGESDDIVEENAVDGEGNAYVVGITESNFFPRKGPPSAAQGGVRDAFVAKYASGGPLVPGPPNVIGVSPKGGSVSGGTAVTIQGYELSGAAVTFGGVPASSVKVESDFQLTAVSPPHAEGAVDVVVTTPVASSTPNPFSTFVYGEGSWSKTGLLGAEHTNPTATLLASGKVLVVGGTTAELYDPRTGTWTPAASPILPRSNHTATLLTGPGCGDNCGKVLVTGDTRGSTPTTSAELYDPEADNGKGAWRRTADLKLRRYLHSATQLPNGNVLVVGGCASLSNEIDCTHDDGETSARPLASAEIYDPATEEWRLTRTPPGSPRAEHTATLLAGPGCDENCGKVLLVGGIVTDTHTQNPFAPPELYDPATETWSSTSDDDGLRRYQHTATLLPNSKVLVAGGAVGEFGERLDAADLYDPAANAWKLTRFLHGARERAEAVLLPGGKVLAIGGTRGALGSPIEQNLLDEAYFAELFDPQLRGGSWGLAAGPIDLGSAQTATLLSSDPSVYRAGPSCAENCGKVLVVSGRASELYDLEGSGDGGGDGPGSGPDGRPGSGPDGPLGSVVPLPPGVTRDTFKPTVRLIAPRLASDNSRSARFKVRLVGTDVGTGIRRFVTQVRELRARKATRYRTVPRTARKTRFRFRGRTGRTYQLRVRAIDGAGNASRFVTKTTVAPLDDTTRAASFRGFREQRRDTVYYGSYKRGRKRNGRMSFSYRGGDFYLIGLKSRLGGKALLTVDGKSKKIDTYAPRTIDRALLARAKLRANRRHRVRLRVLHRRSPKSRGFNVRVDALGVFRRR